MMPVGDAMPPSTLIRGWSVADARRDHREPGQVGRGRPTGAGGQDAGRRWPACTPWSARRCRWRSSRSAPETCSPATWACQPNSTRHSRWPSTVSTGALTADASTTSHSQSWPVQRGQDLVHGVDFLLLASDDGAIVVCLPSRPSGNRVCHGHGRRGRKWLPLIDKSAVLARR